MPPKKKRGRPSNPPIPLNPPSPTPPGSGGTVSVLPTIYIASNLFDDDDDEEEDWVVPTIANVFTASSPPPPPETIEIPDSDDLPAGDTTSTTTTTTTEVLDPEKSLKLSSPVPSPSPPPPRPISPFVPEPTSGLCDLCGGLFLGEEEDKSGETFSDHVCGAGLCPLCGYLYLDRDDFKRHEGECGIFKKEDPPPPVLTPIKNQATNSAEAEGTPPNITDVNYSAGTKSGGTKLLSKPGEKLVSKLDEKLSSKSEVKPSPKSKLNPKFLKIRNPDSKKVKDPEWELGSDSGSSGEAEDDNDADVVFTIKKKDTEVDKEWAVRPRRAAAQRKSYKF